MKGIDLVVLLLVVGLALVALTWETDASKWSLERDYDLCQKIEGAKEREQCLERVKRCDIFRHPVYFKDGAGVCYSYMRVGRWRLNGALLQVTCTPEIEKLQCQWMPGALW